MKKGVLVFLLLGLSFETWSAPRFMNPVLRPNESSQDRAQDLEELRLALGSQLTQAQYRKIQDISRQAEELRARPQNVATFGGIEILPLVCGQVKANLPAIKGLAMEIEPCIDPSTGRSYIMTGGSFTASAVMAAGVQAGIYVGPAHLNKPVVGRYGYVGISRQLVPFIKASGQLSLSQNCLKDLAQVQLESCQVLAFGGLGVDLSGLFSFMWNSSSRTPASPNVSQGSAKMAGVEVSYGIIFQVKEFPWFERLKNGASLAEAFDGAVSF